MRNGSLWRCPRCRGDLEEGWRCLGCGVSYRALRGIPDLRTRDDVYLTNAEDWAIAAALDRDFDRLDFRRLLDRYFELEGNFPDALKERQIAHILTAPGRVGRWLDAVGTRGLVLDLGCGSGSFLAAVGRSVDGACGVDIAMRWLIVARKRLDEEGLGEIPLACAPRRELADRNRSG